MTRRQEVSQRHRGTGRLAVSASEVCPVWSIVPGDPHFPVRLVSVPALAGEKAIYGIGDRDLLKGKCVGLICSVKCPGSIVIRTFDAIRELRDAGVVVACGFHSPMERECLDFLLRGKQPIIVCAGKGLGRPRLPTAWREAIDAGRLLLVTPFDDSIRRTSKLYAQIRNQFVAALAAAVLIPHASPGGQAEVVARSVMETGKPLFTFADDENQNLCRLGARSFDLATFTSYGGG